MPLDGKYILQIIYFIAGNNKDVFDAIDFAAQYPFRAGASKVVIVLPCSNCGESKLSYRSIAERLNTEDITVHVINDFSYDVTVEGKNPASNYLFGKILYFCHLHQRGFCLLWLASL